MYLQSVCRQKLGLQSYKEWLSSMCIKFAQPHCISMQGFLPEAADNFAVNYVYPAFSPTLGVFLAISVVYGLLKVSFAQS